ncbi:MAG: hypothetical protein J3R72DRAFT_123046 [Linnemannia gamsii]|nr:MAG: hypothetical protein J3R72DRAFT_123046 [Linnemannia gamsii]
MQQPSQPSSYNLQDQQHRHQQFVSSPVPGTHSPNPHPTPLHQNSYHSFQGQWTRKRGHYSDPEETPTVKKRLTGSESEGLFGWSDLLAATTHSPVTISSRFPVETRQGYFDQQLSYNSNPATPPMDPGVSPLVPHFTRFQPSGFQHRPPRNSWGESGQGEGHGQLNSVGPAFGQARMVAETSSQGGPYYHVQDQVSRETRQTATFRSISPAPSSPSGSIGDSEANTGFATSMVGHLVQEGVEGLTDQSSASIAQEKRASSGRTQFVMGFRPGCEKCQRREKGHFAHFS